MPADAEAASEFRYRNPIIEPDTLYVAVSQSGETADTAFAVREIKRKGGQVIGLVNVVGSTIARECDGGIYLHAGPEISVASTKALTHMGVGFALLALLARPRPGPVGRRRPADHRRPPAPPGGHRGGPGRRGAHRRASRVTLVDGAEPVLHRPGPGFPVAREGAQKFKEISYRHAEAYQTSELKHGPLALIEESLPTVASSLTTS